MKNLFKNIDLVKVGLESYTFGSEEEQLEAVKKDVNAIQYIHNPTEIVQLEAVKQDGHAIVYIHNPTEKVQEIAVSSTNKLFPNITSEKVIKEFLDKYKMDEALE